MLSFRKRKEDEKPVDVKEIRDSLLQFIKRELQKAEGGEGGGIRGLRLHLAPPEGERHLYEAAVYTEEEGRFREEIQRIADDYALQLPADWTFDLQFSETLPAGVSRSEELEAGLIFSGGKGPAAVRTATATIRVLVGEAEKEAYTIRSGGPKVNIGRDKRVQTSDGFFRENNIAFPANSADDANKYISRQHAHIEWDGEAGQFLLFADEGGVPPRNKIKVRSVGGNPVKLQTVGIGHVLKDGDQIILGESALLEFSFADAPQ